MKHLTEHDIDRLQKALQVKKRELTGELSEHGLKENGEWEPMTTSVGEATDQSDIADNIRELLDNAPLEEEMKVHAREIDEALARIHAGTYGLCTVCGKEISLARLEANPSAATCVGCA